MSRYVCHLPPAELNRVIEEHDRHSFEEDYIPRKNVMSWRKLNNIAFGTTPEEREARRLEARSDPDRHMPRGYKEYSE